jgi:protease I
MFPNQEAIMQDLTGFKVAVIATDGFEESELTEPVTALKNANAEVSIVSLKHGKIQGFKHFDKSNKVEVDQTLGDITVNQFDGLMLPGGALNADALRTDKKLRSFLKDWNATGKPIAAICHAPWELSSADIVKGKTLTSYYTIQDDLRNAGANWVDKDVVVDGNLVTSRKPDDLPGFNQAMLVLFGEHRAKNAKKPVDRDVPVAI